MVRRINGRVDVWVGGYMDKLIDGWIMDGYVNKWMEGKKEGGKEEWKDRRA